jgi:hypothetical protein
MAGFTYNVDLGSLPGTRFSTFILQIHSLLMYIEIYKIRCARFNVSDWLYLTIPSAK